MNFFLEWALAVHRAVWFPVNWALGLERPPMQAPMEIGVALATRAPLPIRRRPKKRTAAKRAA
jgi:hypothetical protein